MDDVSEWVVTIISTKVKECDVEWLAGNLTGCTVSGLAIGRAHSRWNSMGSGRNYSWFIEWSVIALVANET